jgi:hypothetical protein
MKPTLLSALLLAAAATTVGCAALHPTHTTTNTYSIESLELHGLPVTQLAAARESSRADSHQRVLARNDVYDLSNTFAANLRHDVRLADQAPYRLRIDISLNTPGQFEGFGPENIDLAANVQILDANGGVVRAMTIREIANAPLQRSASRRERLEAALSRLSQKIARQL